MRVKTAAIGLGGMVGVPIYFVLEGFIRLLNLGRAQPLTAPQRAAIAAASAVPGCEVLCDIQLNDVEIVAPARLPIGHRGITLGRTIFSKTAIDLTRRGDHEFFVHEMAHVAQREGLGRVGMARHYAAHYCDGFSYRSHAMEIEARDVAAAADTRWPDGV